MSHRSFILSRLEFSAKQNHNAGKVTRRVSVQSTITHCKQLFTLTKESEISGMYDGSGA